MKAKNNAGSVRESAALDAVAEARGVNVSRAVGALAVEACATRKRGAIEITSDRTK